ncbi:MAG: signal peptidase II [Geminicoccaceae bacterium]|nr:signal peptidase II [Geminicoccaceae bacterium]
MLRYGLVVALLIVVLDQATKLAILGAFTTGEVRPVLPFFNLVLVWNRGVSFGMFDSDGNLVRWLLTGFALLVVVGLAVWLRRADSRAVATALGLVIGGALGNVIDRIRFGAVVDFLDIHVASWHWPAFNVADGAICIGAALLVLDSLFAPRSQTT